MMMRETQTKGKFATRRGSATKKHFLLRRNFLQMYWEHFFPNDNKVSSLSSSSSSSRLQKKEEEEEESRRCCCCVFECGSF